MPGFDAILGQHLPIRLLRQFISTGTIPHALLFTGIDGIGKRSTAGAFSMAVNCLAPIPDGEDQRQPVLSEPCGHCAACRRIATGRHPDILTIKPDKSTLRIDQIRSLLSTLAMKPFNARQRVVIIEKAQSLTAEAGNALLKILEEPPPDTIIILIARRKTDLLPTIVSRCRCIRFQPLTPDQVQTLLRRDHPLDAEHAAIIANMADGSYDRAVLLASEKWRAFRDLVIQAICPTDPRAEKKLSTTLALAFSSLMSQRKEQVQELFDIIDSWLRDLAVAANGETDLIHNDQHLLLKNMGLVLDPKKIIEMWEAVQQAKKNIASNGNLRLTLDVMALRFADSYATTESIRK